MSCGFVLHSFTARALTCSCLPLLAAFAGAPVFAQTQNSTYSYSYDANGNLTQITDPLGRITTQSFDSLSRLTQQLQPAPGAGGTRPVVKYTYDGLDQLQTVTDPRNMVTSYTVDGLGNRMTLTSPDTGTTGNTYDAAGNLKSSTDARGKTTTYSYDALNRVTAVTYTSGTATTFEYDGGSNGAPSAIGQLTRMSDESGQTTYTYDAMGRLSGKIQTVTAPVGTRSFIVSLSRSASGSATGKVTALTYPSGNRINVTYDAAGRINSLTLNPTAANGLGTDGGTAQPLLTQIGYAPFGPPISWTWGNSSETASNTYARGLDLDGRITGYPLGNGVHNGLDRSLAYDAASRITGMNHSGLGSGTYAPTNFNQTFGYDDLDRLMIATGAASSQRFQHDSVGNRTQMTVSNGADMISGGSLSFAYSDRGRMKSASVEGGTVEYLYNGLGQRVHKSGPAGIVSGGGSNSYVYDEQGKLLGEYDADGKVIQETVYLGDMPVAVLKQTVTGTAPSEVTATAVYYVYADHLNAPRVITQTSDNQIVWRWDNADAFGTTYPDENPGGGGAFVYNLRFPGQYFDRETNLHYNYFRDYDPATGRYIQSDPIGLAGGINTYLYVRGDPVSKIDPDGLMGRAPGKPGPHYPNGNYTPGYTPQDGVCTVPGPIGNQMNASQCISGCCSAHDACYTSNGCNASSWYGNFQGFNSACQQCNSAAVSCVVNAIFN
jgi:RHS repeat-associated protein